MVNRVLFNEVSFLFDEYTYFSDEKELFWYRYMWSLLERHNLTVFSTDVEQYSIYFRAAALIYMLYGFASAVNDDHVIPDNIYGNCLEDLIPAFVLGQMYAKEGFNFEEDESYAVFALAQKEYHNIMKAVKSEMTLNDFYFTLSAILHTEIRITEDEEGDEIEEEWSPETYEDYFDLITNRLSDVDIYAGCSPQAAYEFVVDNGAYFDCFE